MFEKSGPMLSRGDSVMPQRGFTIVEGLIAAAIVGIVFVAVNAYFSSTYRSSRSQNAISVRDQIYTSVRGAINPESLHASMTIDPPSANQLLRHCINPDSAADCQRTNPKSQIGFQLQCPDCTDPREFGLAGPPGMPKLYDKEGRACQTAIPGLPPPEHCEPAYKVTAWFWATCPVRPNGAIPGRCAAAETIWVRIQVRPLSVGAGRTDAGALKLKPMPPDENFSDKKKYAIPVATKDIRLIGQTSCNLAGQRITGYDQYGRAICTCMTNCTCPPRDRFGNVLDTSSPSFDPKDDVSLGDCSRRGPGCRCTDSYCDPRTHFMAGLDATNKAICIPRTSLEQCTRINIQQNGDCGEGSQMVQVIYGTCSHSRQPKGGGWKINCEDDHGTCCQMAF